MNAISRAPNSSNSKPSDSRSINSMCFWQNSCFKDFHWAFSLCVLRRRVELDTLLQLLGRKWGKKLWFLNTYNTLLYSTLLHYTTLRLLYFPSLSWYEFYFILLHYSVSCICVSIPFSIPIPTVTPPFFSFHLSYWKSGVTLESYYMPDEYEMEKRGKREPDERKWESLVENG